ncbi:MAG: hypothetical protein FVQ80_01370 [Planctomycetes bacterium]|nr:hypothetical protein [Planctomycetota bacterium]
MKNKKALVIFLVGLLATIFCVISYVMRNPDSILSYGLNIKFLEPSYLEKKVGEKLFDEFESYKSSSQIKASIPDNYLWQVIEDSNSAINDTRPPCNGPVVSLKSYRYNGYSGELVLVFFNDRLMRCVFYPEDVERFEKFLIKNLKIKKLFGKKVSISRNIRLSYHVDYKNRPYFSWEDKRLQKEEDAWIMRYS